jgi:hypothetical protein
VPVLVIRYGFAREAGDVGGVDGAAVVEVDAALAMPRKREMVEGRGRAIGLRNERDMEDDTVDRITAAIFCSLELSKKSVSRVVVGW